MEEVVYFLSDLHIRNIKEEKAQKLLRFFISLEGKASSTQLFLVGDIFDLWLGGHSFFTEKFAPLIEALKRFALAGGKIHYFEGNHDLHLKTFWEQQVGAKVYSSAEYFALQNLTVRVEHGDQMDPEDKGYIFLRWFLRTSPLKWFTLHLPGKLVSCLGEWASSQSRTYTDGKRDHDRIQKVIHTHAKSAHLNRYFDVIVSGHVHLQDEYSFISGKTHIKSYNLGSWDTSSQVLRLKDSQWTWQEIL